MGFISGAIILGTSVYVGYSYVEYQETRLNNLVEFRNILSNIHSDIKYTARPLGEACVIAGQRTNGVVGGLFINYGNQLETDKDINDPRDLWRSKVTNLHEDLKYDDKLKTIYESFAVCLGILDKESQLSTLAMTIADVEDNVTQLKELNEKRMPVAMKLAVTGGLVLAIVVF